MKCLLNDFEIFETIRTTGGGSVLTGIHTKLNPIMVMDGCNQEVEILVVEGDIGERKCIFINGSKSGRRALFAMFFAMFLAAILM